MIGKRDDGEPRSIDAKVIVSMALLFFICVISYFVITSNCGENK
jgi:hypothetical protein